MTVYSPGFRRPKQMPDWWPEIGFKWATYRMSVSPTLILVHPDHPPIIWNHNEDGELDFMRELEVK